MSVQDSYEKGNAELLAAIDSPSQGDSTNHATIACAEYLRAIAEMLGVKFSKTVTTSKEKE